MDNKWQPMDTAPRDGTPIVAWCDHAADPYVEEPGGHTLTAYGAWAEGEGHVDDGLNVVQWGGGYSDDGGLEGPHEEMPDWWFLRGSEFQIPANPVRWFPILTPAEAARQRDLARQIDAAVRAAGGA
jgi:hypothetical protein